LLPPAARNALLATVSVFFYAFGAHALVFLFLASIAGTSIAGLVIERYRQIGREDLARWATAVAVVANLALLFFWKYADFVTDQVGVRGIGITLPLGISFFTFHGISYVVDVHRGAARPMRSLADYGQYMAFFPQLIAGP